MKVMEPINRIDAIKPNAYPLGEKIRWLNELDSIVKSKIVDKHEGAEDVVFEGYTEDTDLATALLVPSPYDAMYLFWLESKIDYWNGETGRYNNSISMFNNSYAEFERYYNRTHTPIGKKVSVFGKTDTEKSVASDGGAANEYENGYSQGQKDGYTQGTADGYSSGKAEGYSIGKDEGYATGYRVGHDEGYTDGRFVGKLEGENVGRKEGYLVGKNEGQEIGYADALNKRTDLSVSENGEYVPPEGSTGFKVVSVNVDSGVASNEKLQQLINGKITELTAEDLQGVTRLREYAFAFTKLESIVVPNTVIYVGRNAFDECRQLKKIVVPNSVNVINQSTFNACVTLEDATLGSGVTQIGDGAFKECKALKSFTINTIIPPTLSSTAFNYCPTDMVIYVPPESVSAYKAATNWSARADMIIGIGEELPQEPSVYYWAEGSIQNEHGQSILAFQPSLVKPSNGVTSDSFEFFDVQTYTCTHCGNTLYVCGGANDPDSAVATPCPYCDEFFVEGKECPGCHFRWQTDSSNCLMCEHELQ